ncbi:MAG TPA: acyl-CoA dehydrogenase family protein [Burkholderiales bacterium]|nr:acyl-CoA dehydrogenase family protein [Burkholderiales bacterium]
MSDITAMLVETATRIFSDHCTKSVLDAAETGAFPQALWSEVEVSGIASMLTPERDGGILASPADAVSILRVAGRYSAPVPLAETMIARWLFSKATVPIGSEPTSIVFLRGKTCWQFGGQESHRTLSGRQQAVPWGGSVKSILVVGADEGTTLGVVEAARLGVQARRNIAGEPRDQLDADKVPFMEVHLPDVNADFVFDLASLFRGALICGALERILELSVLYASDRIQFGRPLSKFQAVQQQLAVLAGEVASATAITDAAARVVGREDGNLMIAAMRSRLANAIDTGTAIAHQVHGAIGFAREYALHSSTRRLWAWRDEYGSAVEWRERLGRAFAGTPADELWPKLSVIGAQTES